MYNTENIFAKIISGELPSSKIYEDDHMIAIKDINPVAPVHVLAIPKGNYKDFADFVTKSTPLEVAHFFKSISKIANDLSLQEYRIVSNNGSSAGQTVFHFHVHIIGGSNFSNLV